MTDDLTPAAESGETEGEQEQTFTQADLDRIVRERVQREKAKYADYNDLKARAEGAKTLEDRIAEVEKRAADAEASALRANIANTYGISAEDRDLFLTGTDEDTLTAQAKRLADRESERKKQGNTSPHEGKAPNNNSGDPLREFARGLFNSAD